MEPVSTLENEEGATCHHFSIRAYVSKIREKDIRLCWPFPTVNSSNNLENEAPRLPPLHVTKFKKWDCQNCLSTFVMNDTAATGEATNQSDSLKTINHSHKNDSLSSHGDPPIQLFRSHQALRDNISEEKKHDAYANGNLLLGNNMEEMEVTELQPTTEDTCAFKVQGHDDGGGKNVCQTVNDTICATTNNKSCLSGVKNGFDETLNSINSNIHGCNVFILKTDAPEKSVSCDDIALDTVSLKNNCEKRKLKRVSSCSEAYMEETPGLSRKGEVQMKKQVTKESCDFETSTVNMDIDESDEDLSINKIDNSGGPSFRRKVRKVRTLKDILRSEGVVVCGKGLGFSEDQNTYETNTKAADLKEMREAVLGIDLNSYPDSPVAVHGDCEEKEKGKIIQDEVMSFKNDEMFTLCNQQNKTPGGEYGMSAFVPWKDGSGFQIARDDVQQTLPRVVSGGSIPQVKCRSSQYQQTEDFSHPRVSANGIYEHTTSDEMEVVALLAKNKHEKHLSHVEGANGNSRDGYIFQPSMGFNTFSPPLPKPMHFGTGHCQTFAGGSSNVYLLSQLPTQLSMRRDRGGEYHKKSLGQLDLLANDLIPATDLLRLMDAGAHTTTSVNADSRQKFTEKPLLSHEHHLLQFPRMDFGHSTHGDASVHAPSWGSLHRAPSLKSFGDLSLQNDSGLPELMSEANGSQVQHSTKIEKGGAAQPRYSRQFIDLPLVPRMQFGQSTNGEASMRSPSCHFFNRTVSTQSLGYSLSGSDSGLPNYLSGFFNSQAKQTPKRKKVCPTQPKNSRSQKCLSRTANSGEGLQIGERILSPSAPMLFPTQNQALHSTINAALDPNQTHGTQVCTVNRNPADFSLPGAGNKYMIGSRELKRKTTTSGDKKAENDDANE